MARRKKSKSDGKDKKVANKKLGFKEFTVNVWITDFNSFEFGFYKKSRNRAKSRQFTKDMDLVAEVSENGETTGMIGYREDLWKKREGMDKRLVMKLFTASLNWKASLDLVLAKSLQLTMGARGLPVTVYSINTGNNNHVIYVERSANKWPFLPENFSFFILDDNNRPHFYRLRKDLIAIGSDYTLYDQHNVPVGELDGKVLTLGGKWYGRVREDHADPRVMSALKLIAGMLIFNSGCTKHVKWLAKDIKHGAIDPKIEAQEADLYMNPRRVR